MFARRIVFAQLGAVAAAGFLAALAGDEIHQTGTDTGWKQHAIERPKPTVVEPPKNDDLASVPKDAVVLFDGSSLDAWEGKGGEPAGWKIADGAFEVVPGAGPIHTKGKFGDVQLHVEWASPNPPNGKGQDRGNSGIFLMGLYEMQVLDSYQADTYADGQAGAIYGQYPPILNASRPPGEWQTYDVVFRRPRFDAKGKLLEPARVTLIQNGVVVQNNEELLGQTNWLHWTPYERHPDKGPIELQDHGHPVRFRNIWLRNLPDRPNPTAQDLKRPEIITLSTQALDRFAGTYVMGTKESDTKVSITRADGHLRVKFPFLPLALAIEPVSPTLFVMPNTDGRFLFLQNDKGEVTGATFQIGDGGRDLMKLKK